MLKLILGIWSSEKMLEIGRLSIQFCPLFDCPLVEIVDRQKEIGFTWFYFFPFNIFWYSKKARK